MRRFSGWQAALALATVLLIGTPTLVCAQAPAAGQLSEVESRDADIVQAAWVDWLQSPETGLKPHLQRLHDVLDNAPAKYPTLEQRGAVVISRADADDHSKALMTAIMAAAADGGLKQNTEIIMQPNTYGRASLLLGWWYNHIRQYDDALKALDHGLSLQPDNPFLVTEKGTALGAQRRFSEAVALYDGWLSQSATTQDPGHRARALRGRGFCLIELNRLEEAEASYKEALQLQPDHKGAQQELVYIQQLREKTATPKGVGVYTTDKAAKEGLR